MNNNNIKNKPEEVKLAVMANDIGYIKKEVEKINAKLTAQYVTKVEFEPIKKIVYGLVTLILISVVIGLLSLILR